MKINEAGVAPKLTAVTPVKLGARKGDTPCRRSHCHWWVPQPEITPRTVDSVIIGAAVGLGSHLDCDILNSGCGGNRHRHTGSSRPQSPQPAQPQSGTTLLARLVLSKPLPLMVKLLPLLPIVGASPEIVGVTFKVMDTCGGIGTHGDRDIPGARDSRWNGDCQLGRTDCLLSLAAVVPPNFDHIIAGTGSKSLPLI